MDWLLLGANAAGDFKLTPVLIYHFENPSIKIMLNLLFMCSINGITKPEWQHICLQHDLLNILSPLLRSAAAATKSLQLCPTLCDPIDSPPGSPVPGILQARTLEWVALSFSNAWKWKVKVKSLSCVLTLSEPMDCSLPGSSIHGIFQARVLEWSAIAFSENSKHSYIHFLRQTTVPQKMYFWQFTWSRSISTKWWVILSP